MQPSSIFPTESIGLLKVATDAFEEIYAKEGKSGNEAGGQADTGDTGSDN
jgi:hypothetical protein